MLNDFAYCYELVLFVAAYFTISVVALLYYILCSQKGVASPPSLLNIFSELKDDIRGFVRPEHGDLTGWAKQGKYVDKLNNALNSF